MTAYEASEWSDLFVATAGASAALLGLLFVAVSINLERILGYAGLRPGRPRPGGAASLARMPRCADPTNAATPSSPPTSVTSPAARSTS